MVTFFRSHETLLIYYQNAPGQRFRATVALSCNRESAYSKEGPVFSAQKPQSVIVFAEFQRRFSSHFRPIGNLPTLFAIVFASLRLAFYRLLGRILATVRICRTGAESKF